MPSFDKDVPWADVAERELRAIEQAENVGAVVDNQKLEEIEQLISSLESIAERNSSR